MNEQQLLVDCLCRLKRSNVTYYLTGSMASNYWGIPRTTHDLDFVIQLPSSAVPAIIREFKDDFYIDEAAVRAAHQPPYQNSMPLTPVPLSRWISGSPNPSRSTGKCFTSAWVPGMREFFCQAADE